MSQPRVRKILNNGAEMPRARTSTSKASGDSIGCPIRPHQDIPSKSKNKIPKSVRYELDNALVSLCDVWFEEIKPYLERNNIKLHVSGDHECAPPTTPAPPPSLRAPGCSHLDPGAASDQLRRVASCVGSSSTPPIVSSARCAKLRTPSRRPLSPLLSVPQTPRDCPQTLPLNCEEKKQERRCIRRKHRRFKPQPQPNWRVPRLCRTYTVLCRVGSGTGSPKPVSASHRPPQPPRDNYYHFIMPRRESVMKNKATQTEKALYVSRGCQSYNATCSLAPRSPKRSPNSNFDRISPTCNAVSVRSDFATSQKNLPPSIICQLKRPEESVAEVPPLLQDDLIDIIAEGNERRLKLLYSSSDKDNHPSFMNLVPNSHQRKRVQKKHPPWR